jgi:hypothetical protein
VLLKLDTGLGDQTDIDGDILICEFDYSYPFMIYGVSRSDIDFDQRKAKQLRRRHE